VHFVLRVLVITPIFVGLGIACMAAFYAFQPRLRQKSILKVTLIFGLVGLMIPLTLSVGIALQNGYMYVIAWFLWPTSFMLMANHEGDPAYAAFLVWSVATLSNIGIYGTLGLLWGSLRAWRRWGSDSAKENQ
jgi:hypothetical protein